MSTTKIEWADAVWNPVTGCTKVSEGCHHCYADRMAHRLQAMGQPHYVNGFSVTLHEDALDMPLRWRKPRRIFVNSMSDLFHPAVPFEFIDNVFATICRCNGRNNHTFMILTKRPARMLEWFSHAHQTNSGWFGPTSGKLDLGSVWLGVSAENQATADERIPLLLQVPANTRFVSCEPLLGPMDIRPWLPFTDPDYPAGLLGTGRPDDNLSWIITGGESGPGARPMAVDWARGIRDQCQTTGVAFFHKQNGEYLPSDQPEDIWSKQTGFVTVPSGATYKRIGKHAAGDLLDGRQWHEFPA